MSATLYWFPVISPKGKALADELKYILGKKFCNTDGTIGYDTELNESNIEYFEGLRDSNIKDADKLIEAIKKYKQVMIRWEH